MLQLHGNAEADNFPKELRETSTHAFPSKQSPSGGMWEGMPGDAQLPTNNSLKILHKRTIFGVSRDPAPPKPKEEHATSSPQLEKIEKRLETPFKNSG